MNGQVRKEITFSPDASVPLFECLIVTGAPATGLLDLTMITERETLQHSLTLLRDMWKRADTLYIPRADLESLHVMECKSTTGVQESIQAHISTDPRKLSRYYIYLLFRYCMSTAGPKNHFCLPILPATHSRSTLRLHRYSTEVL